MQQPPRHHWVSFPSARITASTVIAVPHREIYPSGFQQNGPEVASVEHHPQVLHPLERMGGLLFFQLRAVSQGRKS